MWKQLKTQLATALIPFSRQVFHRAVPAALKQLVYDQLFARQYLRPFDFEVTSPLGIRWRGNSRDKIDLSIYYFGIWEPELTCFLQRHLRPGDVFIDVGSHAGWYSLLASRLVGETGKVICIDASPQNFRRLEEHMRLNNCRNMRLVHAAVWNERSQLRLFQAQAHNSGRSSVKESFASNIGSDMDGRPIEAYPLPELLRPDEIERAAFIKIDTEGAEKEVVQGMAPLLERFPRRAIVAIEVTPAELEAEGVSVQQFFQPFTSLGYQATHIENDYDVSRYFRWSLDQKLAPLHPLPAQMKEQLDILFSREKLQSEA